MSIYFEKLIEDSRVPNKKLIRLSEQRRTALNDGTAKQVILYEQGLVALSNKLRYTPIRLLEQPAFKWDNSSTNWNYEILNVRLLIVDKLLEEAKAEHDPIQRGKIICQALHYSVQAFYAKRSMGWCLSEFHTAAIMNDNFHISNIFNVMSQRYDTINTYKANSTAAMRTYQFKELSSMLWKDTPVEDEKLVALKYVAMNMSDDQMGERVALLTPYVNNTEIQALYTQYKNSNDTVYYKPETTTYTLPVISVEEAVRIVSDTLEKSQTD